ncbi:MAG: DUF2948 family protein [Hyphomicrobium sp.]
MNSREKPEIKLIALDPEDLDVISAHLQDAVITVGEMTYLKTKRRFAAITNRFDWAEALSESHKGSDPYIRRRAALRFEHVLGAQIHGIDLSNKHQTLSVLALRFDASSSPEGYVTIMCAGNASIKLHVECLEAELRDLGAAWAKTKKPEHPHKETGS